MKTNRRYPEGLLVSKKFYLEITNRIDSTLSSPEHKEAHDEALRLVNSYLCGNKRCAAWIVSEIAEVAFSLLRPELDRAIARSARARKAARKRMKINFLENLIEQNSPARRLKSVSDSEISDADQSEIRECDHEENLTPMLNRRQRRALQRELDRCRRRG